MGWGSAWQTRSDEFQQRIPDTQTFSSRTTTRAKANACAAPLFLWKCRVCSIIPSSDFLLCVALLNLGVEPTEVDIIVRAFGRINFVDRNQLVFGEQP